MISVRIQVFGLVQGVGFRFFTKRLADSYGNLKGFVKNEYDGSVVIEIHGPQAEVEDFIAKVKKSPAPSGYVEHINLDYNIPFKPYRSFEVLGY